MDENETPETPETDESWQELDANEDVTDGEPMQQTDGEEVEEVSSDMEAAIYLAQQEAAREQFFSQQPGYQRANQPQQLAPMGDDASTYQQQQQAQQLAAAFAGLPPEYFAPYEPPAEPAYPPQPGAPYGADENGVPYLPPNEPSPYGPPGTPYYGADPYGPARPSTTDATRANAMRAIKRTGPLIFQTGPEAYDGQWRAMFFMSPDPAEYTANGYVLEMSTAGPGQVASWRLVTEAASGTDTPEAPTDGPRGSSVPPGPFGFLDAAFSGMHISGTSSIVGGGSAIVGAFARPPLALVRPTSAARAPTSSTPRAASKGTPSKARPVLVTAPRTLPLPPRASSRGPVALPAVSLAVRRAPITTVIKTPGLAKAIVRLPNGKKGAKLQIRPLPRGSIAMRTPANPYDGRWHDSTKEKAPTSPRANMRLVHRSTPGGAVWRFIPRLGGARAARPAPRAAVPKLRGRISGPLAVSDDGQRVTIEHQHVGGMDPNDPRERITGNPAGSGSGLTDAGAMLVPVSFLNEMQRSRQPAIIGGCACMKASELEPDQRQRVGDFWGDFQRGFSTVDHAVDQGWQAIRPFVPYGDTIDALHRARMGLMYGEQGAGAGRGTSDQAITSAQDLTRRARKGDASAQAQIVQLKQAAARGDANAIRTWRVIVLVSRDDDARIASDAPIAASSSAPSNPLGSLLSAVGRR